MNIRNSLKNQHLDWVSFKLVEWLMASGTYHIFQFIFILVRRSCQEYNESGHVSDGEYLIDPDSPGENEAPVRVYCDMTGKNGLAGTHVGHDSETRTFVKGYEAPLSYSRDISYNISMAQSIALLNVSHNCEQFIKYECYDSKKLLHKNVLYSSWVSRNGVKMKYWGGAIPGSGKCACGMTQTCNKPSKICNCSSNDQVWRYDEGYLTDRDVLPVSKLHFSDTGSVGEAGYHTLGKLTCYGNNE